MRLSTSSSARSKREGTPTSRSTTPDATIQKNFPTRTEWESWKETIREMYIERNMTLARLRDHMAQVHGFVAEDHEYKRRLAQWRFRKNYTSAEKDAVAMHLDTFKAQQHPVTESQFRLNDRPLRMDKIERHRKAARRKTNKVVALQLNHDPSPEPDVTLSTLGGDSEPDMEDHLNSQLGPVPVVQYTFPMAHAEAMMWNADQYGSSQTQAPDMLATSMAINEPDGVLALMFNIIKAIHDFSAGDFQTAVKTLDEQSGTCKTLLETDTWNFVIYMTVLQTLPAWNQPHFHQFYCYLYGLVSRISYQVLCRHPVTNYFRLATDFDSRPSALVKACLLILELGAQQLIMAQNMVKYSGGIPNHPGGGFDFRLLGSNGLGAISSGVEVQGGQQQRQTVDTHVNEMVSMLTEGWYSQDLGDATEVMSTLKRSLESYARRLVGSLLIGSNTSHRRIHETDLLHQEAWQSSNMNMTMMNDRTYLPSTRGSSVSSVGDPSSLNMMTTMAGLNITATTVPSYPSTAGIEMDPTFHYHWPS